MSRDLLFILISFLLIAQHGIQGCAYIPLYPDSDEPAMLSNDDITLGMPMSEVVRAWGEPYDVQTAGQAHLGNQRWVYPEEGASALGASRSRIVYFEDGHVAGWQMAENQNPFMTR